MAALTVHIATTINWKNSVTSGMLLICNKIVKQDLVTHECRRSGSWCFKQAEDWMTISGAAWKHIWIPDSLPTSTYSMTVPIAHRGSCQTLMLNVQWAVSGSHALQYSWDGCSSGSRADHPLTAGSGCQSLACVEVLLSKTLSLQLLCVWMGLCPCL